MQNKNNEVLKNCFTMKYRFGGCPPPQKKKKKVYFIVIFVIFESLLFKPYLSKHLQTLLSYTNIEVLFPVVGFIS